MRIKRKYTDISMVDEANIIDDWKIFGNYLLCLNDDFLNIYSSDYNEVFKSSKLINMVLENNTDIVLSESEELVKILSIDEDAHRTKEAILSDDTGIKWRNSLYLILELKSNYGTIIDFSLKINKNQAELTFLKIVKFNDIVPSELPKSLNMRVSNVKSGELTQYVGFQVEQLSSGSVKHTTISLPSNKGELNIVKNYFGNLSNYVLNGWGGYGGIKNKSKITDFINSLSNKSTRQNIIIAYYGVGNFLDNYMSVSATINMGSAKHIKLENGQKLENGDVEFDISKVSNFEVITISEKSEEEFFNIVYRGNKNFIFIPKSISFTKENNKLIFKDIQCIIPYGYGIIYEKAKFKKIEEQE